MKINAGVRLALLACYVALFLFISTLPRSSFSTLMFSLAAACTLYAFALAGKFKLNLTVALILFFSLRVPFYFNLPQLTDDFYRFLWDGLLLNHGLNPFGQVPATQYMGYFKDPEFARILLDNMNSSQYLSVYPTLHQLVFGLSYFLSGPNLLTGVNVMRTFILLFEFMFILFILFRNVRIQRFGFLYLFHPLVILEGLGNLHFEAIAVPWMAVALIEFSGQRYMRSAVTLSSAILFKLRPALLLPALFFRHRREHRWRFLVTVAICLLIFLLMLEPWRIWQSSGGLDLYFNTFEFNASVYYALREWLAPRFGYNPIALLAPGLAALSAVLILLVSYFKRKANIFELALVVYLIFLLGSAVVHPWYLIGLVFLAIAANRPFILLWTFTVFFSYSHYLPEVGPKWIFVMVEYAALLLAIVAEIIRKMWLQPEFRG